tara:strand:+ start:144 stop:317 length:174 start_codon:yes stop_codon:yes gene_type:complete
MEQKKVKYIVYIDKKTNGTKGVYLYSPGIMNEKKYKKWLKDNPEIEIYKTEIHETDI